MLKLPLLRSVSKELLYGKRVMLMPLPASTKTVVLLTDAGQMPKSSTTTAAAVFLTGTAQMPRLLDTTGVNAAVVILGSGGPAVWSSAPTGAEGIIS
jgi:hypothetical protein